MHSARPRTTIPWWRPSPRILPQPVLEEAEAAAEPPSKPRDNSLAQLRQIRSSRNLWKPLSSLYTKPSFCPSSTRKVYEIPNTKQDERTTSRDHESGRAIWGRNIFTLTSTLISRSPKSPTSRLYALTCKIRPERFQMAGPSSRKISKAVDHRDTKLLFAPRILELEKGLWNRTWNRSWNKYSWNGSWNRSLKLFQKKRFEDHIAKLF